MSVQNKQCIEHGNTPELEHRRENMGVRYASLWTCTDGKNLKKKWQITLKMYYIYLLYACVVLVGQAWSSRHIEVKGQPTGVGFLLLPCGSQGFISCCQGKGHGPLLTEPSGLSAKSFNGSHHLTDGSLESNCPP